MHCSQPYGLVYTKDMVLNFRLRQWEDKFLPKTQFSATFNSWYQRRCGAQPWQVLALSNSWLTTPFHFFSFSYLSFTFLQTRDNTCTYWLISVVPGSSCFQAA